MAKGSCNEVESLATVATQLRLLTDDHKAALCRDTSNIRRMLVGLIRSQRDPTTSVRSDSGGGWPVAGGGS